MPIPAVAVIGPGRVGLALALRLGEVGLRCRLVRGRAAVEDSTRRAIPGVEIWDTWERPTREPLPDVFVVAVPDGRIAQVASRLAAAAPTMVGRRVFHTAGLLLATELEPCRAAGAAVASWHPLQSFPTAATGDLWSGVHCAIEGDAEAVEFGFALAERLGMRPWEIAPEAKPLYHAAAAIAGNLTHLLVAAARELLDTCGLDRSEHPHPLVRLVATATSSALEGAPGSGLTGPIARRDREAIRRHLEALPPHLARVYETLAREALRDTASDWLD